MKIAALRIRNFRTLESLDLNCPSSYSAICGANDSGKTNVIRAIRALVREDSSFGPFAYTDDGKLSFKEDYPKWKDTDPSKQDITIELSIILSKTRDAGFYQFVTKQLSLTTQPDSLDITILLSHSPSNPEPAIRVTAGGTVYSDINAQEVLKKLQSSRSILFHNSTQLDPRFYYPRGVVGHIREITGHHEELIKSMKKTVDRGLAKISKSQQTELETLLGRLTTKYKVGLSMPAFDFDYLPFNITLGERKYEVPLNDWGSGTKNRTLILLTLFWARQIGESDPSASKITPVIIIEEPESFLHPAAQAEFGRVLQDLAEDFQVQVIVTTHSPYLMNLQKPASNILLRRRTAYRRLRDTECVKVTTDNWMAPFGQALGLDADEFKPWKTLFLSGSEAILLVEGETDREYFEMLRDDAHGSNRLRLSGDIVSYEGTGSLRNTVLLRFIKNRYPKLFVTFDLDAADQLEKSLQSLQLEKGKHYIAVGVNAAGKKNIEGLLPDSVTTAVYGANPGLVQAATSGTKEERNSAAQSIKKLLLEEFKKTAKPGSEYFGRFYPIVKVMNRALS